jgi:glycosyltransferase involved in cell wall biosynthesis
VVLEAMAAGTPVVATSVAGIPEMIEDGREGLLVPDGAHARAARAVASILSDRDAASRMAEAALRRVESEFSMDGMIDRVERCFEREVETRAKRARGEAGGREGGGR